ncbi:MAG: hypothetical protein QOE54_2070 [Streptosporangiaceae bacterium]|jgi:hypothetical protein|nr:hypothetical protein [Streptosporangiaceae bacterium]MDX6429704.1 hypothetical protein [Streptosporangiaceae bacterium]
MPAPDARRRLSSRVVNIGMLSVLSVTLVACSSSSTTRYCVDRQDPAGFFDRSKGGYQVAPDVYCAARYSMGSSNYNRYFWYYGGRGYTSHGRHYIYRGSTITPRGRTIKSSSGHTISRGGFGGHSSHHSSGG